MTVSDSRLEGEAWPLGDETEDSDKSTARPARRRATRASRSTSTALADVTAKHAVVVTDSVEGAPTAVAPSKPSHKKADAGAPRAPQAAVRSRGEIKSDSGSIKPDAASEAATSENRPGRSRNPIRSGATKRSALSSAAPEDSGPDPESTTSAVAAGERTSRRPSRATRSSVPARSDEDEDLPKATFSDAFVEGAPNGAPRAPDPRDRRSRADRVPFDERSRADRADAPRLKNEGRVVPPPANEDHVDPEHRPTHHPCTFDESKIDPDVQKVCRRLVRHGYEAYLVGGGVRDLMLGRRPKDFDVATSARPEQVRELFRNSRVIGRRFRLVHVLFHGGKVIEVATFRRNPREDDPDSDTLLIRADNVFGDAHEDAARRDFTINALFFDVERSEILDWVGGMDDLARKVVNTIGDPEVRFHEDPVRILRALKFAGRLDLGIKPAVYDAIVFCRDSLALAARPRVSEEILRLMRGGAARRTIYLAWETGVLDVLLPELSSLLYDAWSTDEESSRAAVDPSRPEPPPAGARVFRLLDHIDRRTQAEGPLDDALLWTLLLLEPLKEACEGARDRSIAVADFLEPLVERLAIPRRFADSMRRILGVLPRLQSGRAGRFARTELFELALQVAHADLLARDLPTAPLKALLAAATTPAASPNAGASRESKDPHSAPRRTPRH